MGRDSEIPVQFQTISKMEGKEKILSDVSRMLGENLDESGRRLQEVLQSHRLYQANHDLDLFQLAALLNLNSADFALLHTLYISDAFGKRDQQDYLDYLAKLEDLIDRTVNVFSKGCGTIWSLIEGTSILLAAKNQAGENGKPILEHPDEDIWIDGIYRGGFIHRLAIDYKTIENNRLTDKNGYIYLVENPLLNSATEMQNRRQHNPVKVSKGGFFDSTVAIKIEAVDSRTVFPQIVNKTTHEGVGFLGAVKQGQVLYFSPEGNVFLDDIDVTAQCYYFSNALFDEEQIIPTEINDNFVIVRPALALNRIFPRPAYASLATVKMPRLPLGDSEWQFSVREASFDADGFDNCVFQIPDSNIKSDKFQASAKAKIMWQEHELYAITILIPEELKTVDEFIADVDLTAWIRAGLERFRANAAKVNIDYYSDDWIISHSLLQDTELLQHTKLLQKRILKNTDNIQ